jgi:predicted permease
MKRLWSVFRSRRLDCEFDAEIAEHLALQEEEFRRAGMAAEDARNAARREFGGVTQTRETYRDRRGLPWLERAAKDLRYVSRGLRRNKAFTAAAVLSLALGIGANTAVFTIFRALMLRMLPVSRPEELVTMYRTGGWGRGYSSYPLYLEIKKRTDLFQDVIARSAVIQVRMDGGRSDWIETLQREYCTGNYFGVLGIAPAIGRLIGESDDRTPHAHPVAVLSYDFWQSRFGGDPSVLGRKIVAGEQPLTVIGVAQRGFHGIDVDRKADLWAPVMMSEGNIMNPGSNWAWIVGRRRSGVSRAQIQAAISVLFRQYLAGVYGERTPAQFRKVALAQQIEAREGGVGLSGLRDRFGLSLQVLMAAVGLVLLSACANVASLLLARGASRRQEIALRVSLGATRGRLIQQALMESLLLVTLGAAVGVAFAYWGTGAILAFLPEPFAVAPDAMALGFAAAVTVGAAILFGLGPAIHATRIDPTAAQVLRAGAGGARPSMRRALVASQVAFSVVLVALAALFGHSMAELRSVSLGFTNQDVFTCDIDPPKNMSGAERRARREQLIERLEQMPGVTGASFAFPGPFLAGSSSGSLQIQGATTAKEEYTSIHLSGPGYFEIIGAAIIAGRGIERSDTAQSRPAAVVNEAFVRRYFPDDSRVLDRVLKVGDWGPGPIVGVVRDIAHDGLRKKPEPTVYLPASQLPESNWEPTIVARATLPPAAVTAGIRREFASLGLLLAHEPKSIRQRIDESIFEDRLLATVGAFFGALALALAAVGLYGVMAYGTARRAREIGIRIALGARRPEVVWMVLRDALMLIAAGLVIGLPASYAAATEVRTLLFDIKPLDPAALGITAAVLAVVGVAAALLPARRAATLEPLSVLRQD